MKEVTKNKNIIISWIEWHFIDAPIFLLGAWRNILLFNLHFFSISFLLKTIFSYWHKYSWRYRRGFTILEYIEVFFSNIISRVLGALARIFLIIIATFSQMVIFIIGVMLIISWVFLPLITIILFFISLILIV